MKKYKDLLDILVLVKDYNITKENDCYTIEHKDIYIGVSITSSGKVYYYVSGCYNSGCDCVEIPIEKLEELKTIVQYLLTYEVTNNE